jgi:hypothetical protein
MTGFLQCLPLSKLVLNLMKKLVTAHKSLQVEKFDGIFNIVRKNTYVLLFKKKKKTLMFTIRRKKKCMLSIVKSINNTFFRIIFV